MMHCDFCGNDKTKAPVMIVGRLANICVACVEFAAGVIAAMPREPSASAPECDCQRPVPFKGLALISSGCPIHGDKPFAYRSEPTNG